MTPGRAKTTPATLRVAMRAGLGALLMWIPIGEIAPVLSRGVWGGSTEGLKSGAASRFEVVRRRRAETRRRYALAWPCCMSYNATRLAAT